MKFKLSRFKKKPRLPRLKCNLCRNFFRAPTRFYRFCKNCREQSELFRFYDVFAVTV